MEGVGGGSWPPGSSCGRSEGPPATKVLAGRQLPGQAWRCEGRADPSPARPVPLRVGSTGARGSRGGAWRPTCEQLPRPPRALSAPLKTNAPSGPAPTTALPCDLLGASYVTCKMSFMATCPVSITMEGGRRS